MRTIRIKLYKFSELSEDVQNKVIESYYKKYSYCLPVWGLWGTECKISIINQLGDYDFLQDGTLFTPPKKLLNNN